MIISFHGTQKRGHNVGAVAVFAAALESFRTNKKTCMISFRNNTPGENIENYAIPGEETSDDMLNNFSFSDIGIDGLLRRAEIGRLQPEQFDNCVTPLVREKNGFDITRATKDTRLEEALNTKWQYIEEIFATANRIYDYVFVYIGSSDNEFVRKINEISDKVVLVVRQGKKEPFPEADKDPAIQKKLCLLVTDFESESVWNFKHIKAEYNIKKNIFTMPHNVKFRDAREDGGLVRFAMKNVNPNRNDYNSFLIYSMKRLLKFCDGNEPDAALQYTPKYEELENPLYKEVPDAKVLEPYAAEATTETFTDKAGFFSRPKQKTVVKLTEDTSQEVKKKSDKNLIWKPTNASEQAVKLQKEVKDYTEKAEKIALQKVANSRITAPVEEPEEDTEEADDYDKMFRFGGQDEDDEENEGFDETDEEISVEEEDEEDGQEDSAEDAAMPEEVVSGEEPSDPVFEKETVIEEPVQAKEETTKVAEEGPVEDEQPAPAMHKSPSSPVKFFSKPKKRNVEEAPAVPTKPVVEEKTPVKEEIPELIVTEEEDNDDDFSFDIPAFDETKDGVKVVGTEEEDTEVEEETDLPEGFEHVDETPFDEDGEDTEGEPDFQVEEDVEAPVPDDSTEEELEEGTEDDFFADDDTEESEDVAEEEPVEESVEEEEKEEEDASEGDFFADDETDDITDTEDEVDNESDVDENPSEDFSDAEDETEEYDPLVSAALDNSDDEEFESDLTDSEDNEENDIVSYSLGAAGDASDTEEDEESFDESDEEEDYVPEAAYELKDEDPRGQMYDEEEDAPVEEKPKTKLGAEFAWLMDESDEDDAVEDGSYDEYYTDDSQDDTVEDTESFEDNEEDIIVPQDEVEIETDETGDFNESNISDNEVDAGSDDSDLTEDLIRKVADLYDDGYRLDMIAKMVQVSEDKVREIKKLSRTISDDYHDGFRMDKIAKRNGISVEIAEVLNDTAKKFA